MSLIAIIGGTGLTTPEGLKVERMQSIETRYGAPSAELAFGQLEQTPWVFLPRHGPGHIYPPHQINYRANIEALRLVGVTQIISVNAVGGIHADLAPKSLVVPDQIIDYTWGRESTFAATNDVLHIDFSYPYDEDVRQRLLTAAQEMGQSIVDGGVFGITQGPRLESAAEIDKLEKDGCSIVGMTGMPEACLAREANIPYASLALVVNKAAGRSPGVITMAEIEQELVEGVAQVRALLEHYLLASASAPAKGS